MPQEKSRTERAYAAAHFGLELGSGSDKDVGLVRSIEGGGVSAEVMTYQFGENYDVWRQLGKPKYSDIKLTKLPGRARQLTAQFVSCSSVANMGRI